MFLSVLPIAIKGGVFGVVCSESAESSCLSRDRRGQGSDGDGLFWFSSCQKLTCVFYGMCGKRKRSSCDQPQSVSHSHLDTWDGEVTRAATRSIGCFPRSQCGLVIEKKRETGLCDINRKVVLTLSRRNNFRETKTSHEGHAESGLALG